MGDFFDINGDGKLDAFEGAMKWDMIDHMESNALSDSPKPYESSAYKYRRPAYSKNDFAYGIINQAMYKDASKETIQKALQKCNDVLAEKPPMRPERPFSKWYVIGSVIGLISFLMGIWARNPLQVILSPLLGWFCMLPAIDAYSSSVKYYVKQMADYPLREEFAKEYAEILQSKLDRTTKRE